MGTVLLPNIFIFLNMNRVTSFFQTDMKQKLIFGAVSSVTTFGVSLWSISHFYSFLAEENRLAIKTNELAVREANFRGSEERSEILKKLYETNAQLAQRIEETNTRLAQRIEETNTRLEKRIEETNTRIDETNARLEQGFDMINNRLDKADSERQAILNAIIQK
jgi:flagellar capping protein FliD